MANIASVNPVYGLCCPPREPVCHWRRTLTTHIEILETEVSTPATAPESRCAAIAFRMIGEMLSIAGILSLNIRDKQAFRVHLGV